MQHFIYRLHPDKSICTDGKQQYDHIDPIAARFLRRMLHQMEALQHRFISHYGHDNYGYHTEQINDPAEAVREAAGRSFLSEHTSGKHKQLVHCIGNRMHHRGEHRTTAGERKRDGFDDGNTGIADRGRA
ncbi:hypothetical protein D3C86_1723810 [compost metagenome]